jgi:hypothetical protein
VKSTIEVLLSKNYVLACTQSASLPVISDEKVALDWLDDLHSSGMLVRYPLLSKPWYMSYSGEEKQCETLTMDGHFSWPRTSREGVVLLPKLLLCAAVLGYLLISVFDSVSWKLSMDFNNLYGSFKFSLGISWILKGLSWLCISLFVILLLRTTLFLVTHIAMSRGIWLFPRLLTENSFFGPFYPLFEWDDKPKDCLGLRWKRFKKTMLKDLGVGKPRKGPSNTKMTKTRLLKLRKNTEVSLR